MPTAGNMNLKEIYLDIKSKLSSAGIESPEFEAKQIIGQALSVPGHKILTDGGELKEGDVLKIYEMAGKRASRYPLQYILKQWEFYSLPFKVGEGVLIPRPDTEILVERALGWLKTKGAATVIDLGSGSGCIAVAIAKHAMQAKVYALEKYPQALKYLKQNVKLNRADVTVLEGDISSPPDMAFDLIVSNPPYIESRKISGLMPEVRFEPYTALDGGEDGLIFYRTICSLWAGRLSPGGGIMVEVGEGQHLQVAELFKAAGLINTGFSTDLNGIVRVVEGFKPL